MKQQIIVERMCDFDTTHTPHNEKVFPVRAIKTLICERVSVVVAAPCPPQFNVDGRGRAQHLQK